MPAPTLGRAQDAGSLGWMTPREKTTMQMTRAEAIEILRYFENEARMSIDDWSGVEMESRDYAGMGNDDLLRLLNEQNSVEHKHVTAIVDR
jgi:hypothetical protein